MRNVIVLCLLAVVLFASCLKDYHNKITGRYLSTQCSFSPLTDSVQKLISLGLVHADVAHAGNPEICDSLYRVEFTTYQKWETGHKGFLIAGILVFCGLMGVFIVKTSRGVKGYGVLAYMIAAFVIGGPLIGAFYYYSQEKEIPKKEYVKYPDGDLENWWANQKL